MNKTFEFIKKSEQNGDLIFSEAREKVSDIKKELLEDIKKIEADYHIRLTGLKNNLDQKEKDHIDREQAQMDQEFIKGTESMRQSFLNAKKDRLLALIGKVTGANGHSGY